MVARMDLRGWYKLRWKILERDKYTCQYCGQSAPNVVLEVDHKLSLADGGTDNEDNLVTSCWACNRGKSGLRQSIVLKRARINKRIIDLPDRQSEILKLLSDNPGLGNKTIADRCNISQNNANLVISRLCRKNKIKKENKLWFTLSPHL
jgi:DNA-binding NarL/FixJ family response regulator